MSDIRALSVRRPWAGLLVDGVKPVENRTWSTAYRGPLVIHAGKTWVPAGQHHAALSGVTVTDDDSPTGYIGTVLLVDVHKDEGCCDPWGEHGDVYHWVVADPRRFEAPVPGKGRLGLYVPPAEVLEMVGMEATRV